MKWQKFYIKPSQIEAQSAFYEAARCEFRQILIYRWRKNTTRKNLFKLLEEANDAWEIK